MIWRFQTKTLPPFSSQALSAEQEEPLLSPDVATEEPTGQLPPPTTNQIPPELLASIQKSAAILPVSDYSETPATPAAAVAEQPEESASDPEHPENQTALSIVSLLPPVQAASTATSLPLNAVPSTTPALTPPTQASHPEVKPLSISTRLYISSVRFNQLIHRIRPQTVIICKVWMDSLSWQHRYSQRYNSLHVAHTAVHLPTGCTIDCLSSHQNLQDLYASEGQLVVLECRVKGVPSPRVAWYRGESVIEDSPDFRILQKSEAFYKYYYWSSKAFKVTTQTLILQPDD